MGKYIFLNGEPFFFNRSLHKANAADLIARNQRAIKRGFILLNMLRETCENFHVNKINSQPGFFFFFEKEMNKYMHAQH